MKALVLLVALFPAAASASTTYTEYCAKLGDFAGSVMLDRQNGEPISTVLLDLEEIGKGADTKAKQNFLKWATDITKDAYEMPRHPDAWNQNQSVQDFTNATMLGCLEALQDTEGTP